MAEIVLTERLREDFGGIKAVCAQYGPDDVFNGNAREKLTAILERVINNSSFPADTFTKTPVSMLIRQLNAGEPVTPAHLAYTLNHAGIVDLNAPDIVPVSPLQGIKGVLDRAGGRAVTMRNQDDLEALRYHLTDLLLDRTPRVAEPAELERAVGVLTERIREQHPMTPAFVRGQLGGAGIDVDAPATQAAGHEHRMRNALRTVAERLHIKKPRGGGPGEVPDARSNDERHR